MAENAGAQLAVWLLMSIIPVLTAGAAVLFYKRAFAVVKFNKIGLSDKKSVLPISLKRAFHRKAPTITVNDKDSTSPSSPSPVAALGSVVRDDFTGTVSAPMKFGVTVEQKRRTVLIATMEYDIEDWKIKIKIGGLGVMAQLMGKNLAHQDLIWVVPCVDGVEYPDDTPGEPIEVTILDKPYQVSVQYHQLNNITYMLLDAPVFRKQTQKDPYPPRMDDMESAIYYSAWNQCVAEAVRRFPIDIYHINDYHGTLAPLYLLPDTVPCCLSLHNAEFQGLWPMRDPRETAEICSVFNLGEKVVSRYVQFGEVFNLLHAGASILRIHQKGFGAVGVSKKYGKRSWARYPIFWGLKNIGALPNPDPTDVAEWDKKFADPTKIQIDKDFEAGREDLKKQAQDWAGLTPMADAELFVFVGRWSVQKGIDLIADVFPAVLEKHQRTQLICVGPTIDLHGNFAAVKLDAMMKKYPGRVFSKPEFTALPPYIFSGAEFALIPSRDEPFGLVAVEFGRKGALGVGSRVGGLGQMPGWWFTIESNTTKHMQHQFKMAIEAALRSDYDTRATMRARSAKQRFPVAQWKEDLEILQSKSIKVHKKRARRTKSRHIGVDISLANSNQRPLTSHSRRSSVQSTWSVATTVSRPPTRGSSPDQSTPAELSLGVNHGPGHLPPKALPTIPDISSPDDSRRNSLDDSDDESDAGSGGISLSFADEVHISKEDAEQAKLRSQMSNAVRDMFPAELKGNIRATELSLPPPIHDPMTPGTPKSFVSTASVDASFDFLSRPHSPIRDEKFSNIPQTPLSTEIVMDEKESKTNTDVTPFFTDPTGLYRKMFEKKLNDLDGKTSEGSLCIEDYLEKSQKEWFNRLHIAKTSRPNTPRQSSAVTPAASIYEGIDTVETMDQFLLPQNHKPQSGLPRMLSSKIGDWPVYAFLIALGQIMAANSYQITLLTGQSQQSAGQIYAISSIFLVATLTWWYVFRRLRGVYVLSLPWFFYGFSFFLLALSPYGTSEAARMWVHNIASAMYAIASAAGAFFFAQNFGSVGGVPIKDWGFRACVMQGTQQIYLVGLWFWGTTLTDKLSDGSDTSYGWRLTLIGIPLAILLWAVGIVLYIGLPEYYRQKPGAVPHFYKSVFRRKIIVWFLVAVFIQNLFMSAPYGLNWSFLWSDQGQNAPDWFIFLLVVVFFVIIWALILWYFSYLSTMHTWIIPIFAVGLGAPRWCQILWATSGVANNLYFINSPVVGALVARGLWLWLGVLDALQGVGVGMILMQTSIRFHVCFTLVASQCVGALATIIARADGLNSVGPGPTFPNLLNGASGLANGWFWIGLISQVVICAGFLRFFRSEQLNKP